MMTPEQSASILARMFGYSGPTDQRSIDQFLAANPAAAARMGKYQETMKQMVSGQPIRGFQAGGVVNNSVGLDTLGRRVDRLGNVMGSEPLNVAPMSEIPTPGQISPPSQQMLANEANAKAAGSSNVPLEPQALQGYSLPTAGEVDQGFFESPEFKNFQETGTAGAHTQDMYNSPFFGLIGSGSLGSAQDKAYIEYLKRTNPDSPQIPTRGPQPLISAPAQISDAQRRVLLDQLSPELRDQQISQLQSQPGAPEVPATPEEAMQRLQEGQQQLALQASQPLQQAVINQMETAPGLITPGVGQAGPTDTPKAERVGSVQVAPTPTPTPASLMEAATIAPQVETALEGLDAAKGKISDRVLAQSFNPESLAQLGLTAPQIEEARKIADIPDLNLTDDQLAKAATLASTGLSLPQAVAQTTGENFEAVAAKFQSATPTAQAQTDFGTITTQIAQTEVGVGELVNAAGVGLNAEQAQQVQADYSSNLSAAQGQVDSGELITAQTAYNLPPTQSATLNQTVVQGAAQAGTFPTAEAAQSSFQQTLQSAQGSVGADELINAKDITKAAEAVEATAATLQALDQAAIAQAQSGTLSQAALAQAQQGTVTPSATVSGQLTKLMEQFNNGTPSWAAGAVRAANAAMAARGLGASSMAGAAIVQSAMEAATPIAAQDAQMFMQMDMANLDKRQQVALANAAAQQNIEMTNLGFAQQAALQNSTNAFALQAQNLSNQQAVVLANAQMKAALQGQVLGINTQAAVTNAARYAESNNINLNNEQQVLLQRSAQALQVDMANLNSTQQTALANLQVQAALSGQQLTNEQQVAMLQSTQAFESAQFTANAQQQAFLQDASARLALEGKVMDITQQTSMFNASRVAAVNDINLTNEQQVILQKSSENLQVDLANLSAGQQTALANAQLRAALQGKVLDNQQQAGVLNAARYAEVNNLNLTNKQQAFVQDANIRAALDGQVLNNQQQAELYNVSRLAEVQDINLTNEQQSLILTSNQNFEVDRVNTNNRQQTALANAQLRAALQGQVLTNEQQVAIVNAERFAEVNNINLSNQQQAFVQEFVSKTALWRVRFLTTGSRLRSLT
jgi:hypothetical protein